MKKTSEAIKNAMEKTTGKLVIAVILTLALTGCGPNKEETNITTEVKTESTTAQEIKEFQIVGETTIGQGGTRLAVMVSKDGMVELFSISDAKIQDDVKALTGSCLQGKVDGNKMFEMVIKLCEEEQQ